MAINDIFDGEILYDEEEVNSSIRQDMLSLCYWKSKDGRVIKVSDLNTNHLRNIALFLMGMGYTRCIVVERKRVLRLNVLRMEWERRLIQHNNKQWTISDNQMNEDINRGKRKRIPFVLEVREEEF